jgi:hypothetical protein
VEDKVYRYKCAERDLIEARQKAADLYKQAAKIVENAERRLAQVRKST